MRQRQDTQMQKVAAAPSPLGAITTRFKNLFKPKNTTPAPVQQPLRTSPDPLPIVESSGPNFYDLSDVLLLGTLLTAGGVGATQMNKNASVSAGNILRNLALTTALGVGGLGAGYGIARYGKPGVGDYTSKEVRKAHRLAQHLSEDPMLLPAQERRKQRADAEAALRKQREKELEEIAAKERSNPTLPPYTFAVRDANGNQFEYKGFSRPHEKMASLKLPKKLQALLDLLPSRKPKPKLYPAAILAGLGLGGVGLYHGAKKGREDYWRDQEASFYGLPYKKRKRALANLMAHDLKQLGGSYETVANGLRPAPEGLDKEKYVKMFYSGIKEPLERIRGPVDGLGTLMGKGE